MALQLCRRSPTQPHPRQIKRAYLSPRWTRDVRTVVIDPQEGHKRARNASAAARPRSVMGCGKAACNALRSSSVIIDPRKSWVQNRLGKLGRGNKQSLWGGMVREACSPRFPPGRTHARMGTIPSPPCESAWHHPRCARIATNQSFYHHSPGKGPVLTMGVGLARFRQSPPRCCLIR